MTAESSIQPFTPPRLLTVAEYLALEETEQGYDELVEGRVVTSPSPRPRHNDAAFEFAVALRSQLPTHLKVLLDLDVDLELAPPDAPGFTRRPDLLVVPRAAFERVEREGGVIRAAEVLVVGEVVSPGSERTDRVTKRNDYADAGIPHYWIIDVTVPVTLVACHLAGEFGYADGGEITGVFRTSEPFAVELDLDALV